MYSANQTAIVSTSNQTKQTFQETQAMNALQIVRNQIRTALSTGCEVAQEVLGNVKLGGKGVNTKSLQAVYNQYLKALEQATQTVFNGLTNTGYLASVITVHTYMNELANKIGGLRRKTTRNFHKSIEAHTTKNAGCFKDILMATRAVKSTIREAGKTRIRLGKLTSSTTVQEVIGGYTY